MAKSNSTELVTILNDAVGSLHIVWTLVEKSLDNGADGAACEMVHKMLPLIGGKLDAAVMAMGGSPTGVFDETLDEQGIRINVAFADACQQ